MVNLAYIDTSILLFYMVLQNIFMYAVNLEDYGHLVDVDAVSTTKLHNDLWQIATNPEDWEKRYLHPDHYKASQADFANEMVWLLKMLNVLIILFLTIMPIFMNKDSLRYTIAGLRRHWTLLFYVS